ncbi:MAG: 2Fe-2S iron-sulfur cluster-binding protein [Pseudomonadota bacterium]|nr:2Fe-2S iron-sulfur cluster-binding protein [Pseudomonadota bacterium]
MPDAVTLTFRESNGDLTHVTAKIGQSVMEAAIMANVTGIEAECGGSLSCATCHVYAPDALVGPGDMEDAMLDDTASERRECSRLSCQLVVAAEMDGLTFDLPDAQ